MRTLMTSLAVCVLALSGCSSTITKAVFYQKCDETVNLRNTLTGQVLYRGSKKGYDYFLFQPFGFFSQRARAKEGEVELSRRFPYTADETQWLVVLPDSSLWINVIDWTNSTRAGGTNLIWIQMVDTNR
jgi:hypothetical protein